MVKTKRGCLGCSLPVAIIVLLLVLGIFAIGFIAGPVGKSLFGDILPSWLSIPQPKIELPANVVFHVFSFPVTNTLVTTWISMLVLVLFSIAATRKMKIIPGRVQNLFESLLGFVYNLCQDVAGEKNGRAFFPVVCTVFLFVGFNAWLGLIPGYNSLQIHTEEGWVHLLRPANTDFNTPLAIALSAVLFVQVYGLKALKIKYLQKFFNFGRIFKSFGLMFKGKVMDGVTGLVTGVVEAFVGFLELLSELVIHVISFTFRLFGNMTAGEILLMMIGFLVPMLVPIIFYGLEVLIGFIQAIIFSGLTLIFMTTAVSHHEEEHA
jgi:F-type H+-transporting ATPase subunit a